MEESRGGHNPQRGSPNLIWKIKSSDVAVINLCPFYHLMSPKFINLGGELRLNLQKFAPAVCFFDIISTVIAFSNR